MWHFFPSFAQRKKTHSRSVVGGKRMHRFYDANGAAHHTKLRENNNRKKNEKRRAEKKSNEQAIKLSLQWFFNVSIHAHLRRSAHGDDDDDDDGGDGDEPVIYTYIV